MVGRVMVDVLVPLIPGESRQRGDGLVFQTLHAIYSKQCLPFIEARIAQGMRQVVGFFEDVRVYPLSVADISDCDPGLQTFFNANNPEALRSAAEKARESFSAARPPRARAACSSRAFAAARYPRRDIARAAR